MKRIPEKCIENPCPSCIAGDVAITTDGRGVVAARDVVVGDRIPGAGEGEWCEVVAAVRVADKGKVFGNFTDDHFVVAPADAPSGTHVVRASGTGAPSREADLVNIATTCPAARATSGELFTPLSTVFCKQLTWDEYLPLYGALMRIVAKTGGFWFDPSTYGSAPGARPGSPTGPPSSPALPGRLSWMERLPDICDTMRSCTARGARCSEFERLAGGWVRQYLPPAQYEQVRRSYPRLGDPDARRGNLLQDVDPRSSSSSDGQEGGRGAGGWRLLLLGPLLVGGLL
ncbi:uncharacterized protein Tco025E_08483 [Trypanosoma conorhini]|uniref:Uncharacterized protein n=1 Tax=Trypanosoma conorhini TaxID=83891 RepID=A0A422N8Z5_9TRYP|nr:uncharacterized protein Tco025E_08483 [Trypanosoma conorhini]RNF01958.1 hypothetical protein Tco025E_08483 [Trypanosoma conorhini]